MKTFWRILPILFLGVPLQAGLFSSGGSPDYSNNAGSTFYCSNLSTPAVTTAAGISRTGPALALSNPWGSGKNLVLLDVGLNVTASPAAAVSFMLAYSSGSVSLFFSTNTTVVPALLPGVTNSTTTQSGLSSGKCYGGLATLLTNNPIAFRYLGGTTGASAISGEVFTDQTQGKVVIPPGTTVSIQATSAASIQSHMLWREDNQ